MQHSLSFWQTSQWRLCFLHNPLQFRQAVLIVRKRRKTSIFVRKTLRVRLRDQKALAFLARREGLAFFDEDGVCAGFWCVHSLSELLPQSVTLFFRGRTPFNTLAG